MKNSRILGNFTVCFAVLSLTALSNIEVSANEDQAPNDHLANLPRQVQETIKAEVGRAKVNKVQKVTQDGETTFEVHVTQTMNRTLKISGDGTLVGFELFQFELPSAVKKALRTDFAKAKFAKIYRETEDEDTVYSMEVMEQGRTNSLSVAEDGAWWSLDVELDQTPSLVQQTVRRLWGTLEISDLSKTFEDGEVAYELEAEKDGKQHSLTIAPDGRLVAREDELDLALVPAVVQQTVKGQIGTGELVRIARATNEVRVSFEVEARKDGKNLEFSVDPAGKLLEDEK